MAKSNARPQRIQLAEIGRPGLNQYNGYVFEEILPELSGFKWRRIVRQMVDDDAVISAMLFAIQMFSRQVTWDIKPASEDNEHLQDAALIKGALFEDMSQSWPDTLSEILTFLPWGWSYLETVYKYRSGETREPGKNSRFNDGKVGWRKWAIRSQESLDHWEFDDEGGLQAMVQLPPPDFQFRTIPIEKALHFRTTVHKGNPEPKGIVRSAYRQWYRKINIENSEAIGIERELTGYPVAEIPSKFMDPNAGAAEKALFAQAQKIVTNVRMDEQGGLVWPSDRDPHGNKLFDFRLLTTEGKRAIDTDKVIQRCDQRMLMTVMADFLVLGHTQKSGSYGLGDKKGEMFSTALGAWLDSTCGVINKHGIPRLMRLNGRPADKTPQLTRGDIDPVDLIELGQYIADLSGAGIQFGPDEVRYLKEQVKGMPVMEEQEASQPGAKEPSDKPADNKPADETDNEDPENQDEEN